MPVDAKAAGAAVLEIERFEWAASGQIELVGYWSGLRGRRFMRPTLVLHGAGQRKRLLATLDHKPWNAEDGEQWIAAFAWEGDPVKCDSADLNVGSGIDVALPPPRMRPGKPRRFRHRAVSRDATRDDEPTLAVEQGIVSDPPPKPKPAAKKPAARKPTAERDTAVAAPKARPATAATQAMEPPVPDPEPEETGAAEPDATAVAAAAQAELASVREEIERVRKERDGFRRELDAANEKVRSLRSELEGERQAREKAVGDARAAERESASKMMAEGAELRAGVERQREIAYLERDDAKGERDKAVADRDSAVAERDQAVQARKQAERDRKEAFAERDRAVKARERAEAERSRAIVARDEAMTERNEATKERDEIVSVHERGLPVTPPKPRFLPDEEQPQTDLDVWLPRGVAIGILVIFAFIVLRLIAGA